jgi:hypothetical protein
VPWALAEQRIPIVCFQNRTSYWVRGGHRGSDNVWEYYFKPLLPEFPFSSMPLDVLNLVSQHPPDRLTVGYSFQQHFISNHFGDHKDLKAKTLVIPYRWDDPDELTRIEASRIIRSCIIPRPYLFEECDRFFSKTLSGRPIIGVHIRGTDAASKQERRPHRQGMLKLKEFAKVITSLLKTSPTSLILVASDAEASIAYMRKRFGDRVVAYPSIRHSSGTVAGKGPTGLIMPAYIATDPRIAAKNGEEAIIEYLLLSKCNHLVHNGSGLARTVLLKNPDLEHTNTHVRRGPTARGLTHSLLRPLITRKVRELATSVRSWARS